MRTPDRNLSMYDISIETGFSAAHALYLDNDQLEPLHGHDWRVTVTVAADKLDRIATVMDFHELHRIVDEIIEPFHNHNLNHVEPFNGTPPDAVNPSAESVAHWIGHRVAEQLPERVRLAEVAVGEAPGCTARYRP